MEIELLKLYGPLGIVLALYIYQSRWLMKHMERMIEANLAGTQAANTQSAVMTQNTKAVEAMTHQLKANSDRLTALEKGSKAWVKRSS